MRAMRAGDPGPTLALDAELDAWFQRTGKEERPGIAHLDD